MVNAERTIEEHHRDRESGTGCPEVDGGPHYFAYLGMEPGARSCIDCGAPEPEKENA